MHSAIGWLLTLLIPVAVTPAVLNAEGTIHVRMTVRFRAQSSTCPDVQCRWR